MELFASRKAAADSVGISKDTWKKVEEGKPVIAMSYAKIDRAFGWATGSCIAVADGGEPVLVDDSGEPGPRPAAPAPLDVESIRRAAFEAARTKLPLAPIGEIDAFTDELVEVLRRIGEIPDRE